MHRLTRECNCTAPLPQPTCSLSLLPFPRREGCQSRRSRDVGKGKPRTVQWTVSVDTEGTVDSLVGKRTALDDWVSPSDHIGARPPPTGGSAALLPVTFAAKSNQNHPNQSVPLVSCMSKTTTGTTTRFAQTSRSALREVVAYDNRLSQAHSEVRNFGCILGRGELKAD